MFCSKSIKLEMDNRNTITKEKCGEIFFHENRLFLICLYCDEYKQTLEEFREHIFRVHLFEENTLSNNQIVINEVSKNGNIQESNEQKPTAVLQKKFEPKIVRILARRKSPSIFETNWKKFSQQRSEFTNKIYEEVKKEENINSEVNSNYIQGFASKNTNMSNNFKLFQNMEHNKPNDVRSDKSCNYDDFENDLLNNSKIYKSDEEITNDNEIYENFNVNNKPESFLTLSNCNIEEENLILDHLIKPQLLEPMELVANSNQNSKSLSLASLSKNNVYQSEDEEEISSCSTKHDDGYFYCPLCPKFYRRFQTLKIHYRYHTGEKNPYDCPVCEKSFAAKCRLEAHYRVHSDERPFPCHKCNRAFRQKQKLKQHLESHEKGTIKDVSNPYHNPASLPILINNRSIGAENTKTISGLYQCPLCFKSYKRFDSLKEHAEIHIEGLDHNCPFCQKTLKTFRCLRKHMTSLHLEELISVEKSSNCTNI